MNRHESQRGYFAYSLWEQMKHDKDIWLICPDLGYRVFDKHFEDFPDRCINCGAAEMLSLGLASGLALENKKPFVYTITSFFLRAAEPISLFMHHEKQPIHLVGSGLFSDYHIDGMTHDGFQAQKFLDSLEIDKYYPTTKEQIPQMVNDIVLQQKPTFIGLRR